MRQRVMIAMALVNDPDLLIADEPTTALDVTTQAQILNLIDKLKDDFGSAVIIPITHALGVIAEVASDVVVMYAARGRRAGAAPSQPLQKRPAHPYTWGLLGSLPRLDATVERLVQIARLAALAARGRPARLPLPHPRCPYVMNRCKTEEPPLLPVAGRRGSLHGLPSRPGHEGP